MAETTAAVKLTLKDRGFRSTFRQAAGFVKDEARAMGNALRGSLSDGVKGGMDALRGLGSTVKGVAGMAAGIVGAAGLGSLVKGAIEADAKFRKLGFTMKAGSGAFQSYAEIQRFAEETALRWAQSSDELADALEEVFNTTGDGEFARDTLEAIAVAAQASTREVGEIAPIVAELNRQFGLTADQIPDALAAVLDLGRRGGLSIEEIGAHMGKLGKLAESAGLQGEGGMRRLIAMTNMLTAPAGSAEAAVEKLNQAVVKMLGSAERTKQLQLLGIDTEGRDAIDVLEQVMRASKGDATLLSKVLGEDALTFDRAFGGVDDLSDAIDKAAKVTGDGAATQQKARAQLDSASSGMARAVETLEQAFRKPEMMAAIESIASHLPEFAKALADAMAWVGDNPFTAGALYASGTFGKGAIGGMLSGGGGTATLGIPAGAGTQIGGGVATELTAKGGGIGSSIARGFAAAPGIIAAGSLMAASIAAAVEQAQALSKDIDAMGRDLDDERGNLAGAAWQQGEGVTTRDRSDQERFLKWGGSRELVSRDAEGNVTTQHIRDGFDFARNRVGPGLAEMANALRGQAFEQSYVPFGPEAPADSGAPVPRGGADPNKPIKVDQSEVVQAIDVLRQSELRNAGRPIIIGNADEIGQAVARASPAPGWVPRN